MFGIGMTELLVILAVALIVFGPQRLPELARSLGRALGEFRRASTDLRQQLDEAAAEARLEPDPKAGRESPGEAEKPPAVEPKSSAPEAPEAGEAPSSPKPAPVPDEPRRG